ncbi:unnamed protein product [Ectocarpus fasciculatus]
MPLLPEMGSAATGAATTTTPFRLHSNKLLIATASAAATPAGEQTSEAGAPAAPRAAPLSAPGGRENARTWETLEQKWAAWQSENRGPGPLLGKPAPAPPVVAVAGSSDSGGRGMFGGGGGGGGGASSDGGGGSGRRWGGAEDFHNKVAFLGDYVANVFGRAKRMGVPQHCEAREVQYGVE